jgi:hypothetical protein
MYWGKKKSLTSTGIRTLDRPARSLVTISTSFPFIPPFFFSLCAFAYLFLCPGLILCFFFTLHHTTETSMSPVGFETAIPASEQPQAHALFYEKTLQSLLIFVGIYFSLISMLDVMACLENFN